LENQKAQAETPQGGQQPAEMPSGPCLGAAVRAMMGFWSFVFSQKTKKCMVHSLRAIKRKSPPSGRM
jgi:hypothetical protein